MVQRGGHVVKDKITICVVYLYFLKDIQITFPFSIGIISLARGVDVYPPPSLWVIITNERLNVLF